MRIADADWSLIVTPIPPPQTRGLLSQAVAISVHAACHFFADHFDSFKIGLPLPARLVSSCFVLGVPARLQPCHDATSAKDPATRDGPMKSPNRKSRSHLQCIQASGS